MRIPLPRAARQPPPQPSNRRSGAIIAAVIVGVLAICILVSVFANTDSKSSDTSSVDLPTDTPIPDTSGPTATFEAKGTLDALQPILKQAQSWPASFTENFKDNSHEWKAGDVRDSYVSGNRSISDGIYTWTITSVQGASDFAFPNMPDQTDFYVSVDMTYVNMPDDPDADAGLAFRYNSTDQTWYYFSVNDKGQYYFGWYDGNNWSSLIPETDSSAIHPGQTNKLTVGVQGSQFIFLINGQMVDHFIDHSLKSGTIGVGVNLPKTGEKATVQFKNFTVLSAAAKP